jgi:hypothetical protein
VQQRPGIFLVAGPNADGNHLGLPSGLADSFGTGGGLYELASSHGEDLAHVFGSISKRYGSSLAAARAEG